MRFDARFTFDHSDEGFIATVTQPNSKVRWDRSLGRIAVTGDARDSGDALYLHALPARLRKDTSFRLTSRWMVTDPGVEQHVFPLVLSTVSVLSPAGDPNVLAVEYETGAEGQTPQVSLVYTDGTGVHRIGGGQFRDTTRIPPGVELRFQFRYDARSRALVMIVREPSGVEYLHSQYRIGSADGDGFTFEAVGVATRGAQSTEDRRTLDGWTDDIAVSAG